MALIKKYLEQKGEKVLDTKEPTNNLIGGLIRGVLTGEWKLGSYGLQLLFCADRAHHLEREIMPALEKGWNFLTDRYLPSTVVYGSMDLANQHYNNKGLDHWWKVFMEINREFKVPDLTLLLDLDAKICMERIQSSRAQTELFETEETLRKVVEGYRRFAQEYPDTVLIDGTGDAQEVHERIRKTIEERHYHFK